jgi:cyclase
MPALALQGGAETMYPEFAQKLRGTPGSEAQNSDKRQNPRQQKNLVDDGQIHIFPVQGEVYMLAGAGANITVQVGDDAVLVVDAGESGMSDKVIAAIRQISNKPFRTLISTNFDPDHVGGNEKVAQSGSQIGGNGSILNSGLAGVPTENSAAIVAQENVLTKMSAPTGGKAAAPTSAWPTETYATDEYEVVNGEGIQIFHEPAAHADGDSLVYFRRSDVISTGDIFSTVSYPVVDLRNGGTINGVIAGLNHILDLAIPKDKQEGGTYIIPGQGRVCDEADVLEYRDVVTIIRDRVLDLMKKGMTLEQITAAKPTLDYDGRYNAAFWTADMFVEAVYRSLNAPGGMSTAR